VELLKALRHVVRVGVARPVSLAFQPSDPASNVCDACSAERLIEQDTVIK
jgi:hypothetical protein